MQTNWAVISVEKKNRQFQRKRTITNYIATITTNRLRPQFEAEKENEIKLVYSKGSSDISCAEQISFATKHTKVITNAAKHKRKVNEREKFEQNGILCTVNVYFQLMKGKTIDTKMKRKQKQKMREKTVCEKKKNKTMKAVAS